MSLVTCLSPAAEEQRSPTDYAFFELTFAASRNLGDEIQSRAARAFLPRVDGLVDREKLGENPAAGRKVKVILNGWFMEEPQNWPPHRSVRPLITSFHLSQLKRSRWRRLPTVAEELLDEGNIDYLQAHGPIGARDEATFRALQKAGVPSYHSGCLTLTLPRTTKPRGTNVIACDLPPKLFKSAERRLGHAPVLVSHQLDAPLSRERRLAAVEGLLDLYARARAVITTRVHCALPCLALGTPVLFVSSGSDPGRELPAMQLAHSCTAAEFDNGSYAFDLNDPPPNPDRHLALATALRRECEAFIRGPSIGEQLIGRYPRSAPAPRSAWNHPDVQEAVPTGQPNLRP